MKTLLDDMAPKNPKAAAADPKSFVDQSLFRKWRPRLYQAATQTLTGPLAEGRGLLPLFFPL